MINPTHGNHNPYLSHQQQRRSSKGVSFAALFKSSTMKEFFNAQVQRSAVTMAPPEEKTEPGRISGWTTIESAEVTIWKVPDPTYPKSIYDLSPAELRTAQNNARDAASDLNTEGKTRVEIYDEIHAIYSSYLGKDFEEPEALYGGWIVEKGSHELNLHMIPVGFRLAVQSAGGDDKGRYDGMSEDQIRAAIREKYPEDMKLRDCLMMAKELNRAGLDESENGHDYAQEVIVGIMSTLGGGSMAKKIFESMLNSPADYDAMKRNFEAFERNGRVVQMAANMDDVFDQLSSWMGGNLSGYADIMSMLREMEQKREIRLHDDHRVESDANKKEE